MSNTDSFVEEVTDAVRRDKLFAAFRKYGWIGILLVVLTVGGAAWTEWSRAKEAARAQAFGDSILAAFEKTDVGERRAALAATTVSGDQVALQGLLIAADPALDQTAALAALDAVIADPATAEIYRDLAILKRVTRAGSDQPLADRRTALQSIAAPGRAYRTLAQEQMAFLLVEESRKDDAIAAFNALLQDNESPAGLRRRAAEMVKALGGVVANAQAG